MLLRSASLSLTLGSRLGSRAGVSLTAAPVPIVQTMHIFVLSCQVGSQAHERMAPSACSTALQGVAAAKRERTIAEKAKRAAEAAQLEVQQYEPPSDDGAGLGDLQGEIDEAKEVVDRRLRPVVRAAAQHPCRCSRIGPRLQSRNLCSSRSGWCASAWAEGCFPQGV